MTVRRTRYNAEYKFETALAAIKGLNTINELASERGVHPTQVSQWKRQLLEQGATIFSNGAGYQQRQATRLCSASVEMRLLPTATKQHDALES